MKLACNENQTSKRLTFFTDSNWEGQGSSLEWETEKSGRKKAKPNAFHLEVSFCSCSSLPFLPFGIAIRKYSGITQNLYPNTEMQFWHLVGKTSVIFWKLLGHLTKAQNCAKQNQWGSGELQYAYVLKRTSNLFLSWSKRSFSPCLHHSLPNGGTADLFSEAQQCYHWPERGLAANFSAWWYHGWLAAVSSSLGIQMKGPVSTFTI